MESMGVIGIVIGLIIFAIASMNGWNVLVASLITAAIIALTNGMGVAAALVGGDKSYVTGMGEGYLPTGGSAEVETAAAAQLRYPHRDVAHARR